MLFHVTMTHTVDDCPGYNREKMPELMAAMGQADTIAKGLDVKVHFSVNAAPEHVSYALLEADNYSSILGYLNTIPMKQDFKITPVQHDKDMLAFGKAMMEQR